jgi:hypothetical protein
MIGRSERRMTTMETLEGRQMLAATKPVELSTCFENGWRVGDPGFGDTIRTASKLEISPMMRTVVQGDFSNGKDVDMFAIELSRGQVLIADGDGANMALRRGDGRLVTRSGSSLAYRARTSEVHYLQTWGDKSATTTRAYTLNVQPIGLNTGRPGPENLDAKGGLYAFRDGRALSISGPSGHGFMLLGNWKHEVVNDGFGARSTYSATGNVMLDTAVGAVTLPIPNGLKLTVNTDSRQYGQHYGEVTSIDWTAQLGIVELSRPFGRSFGLSLANNFAGASVNARGWGVRLGGDPLLKNTGLPLNPAVPYLFYSDYRGFESSFGGVNLSLGGSAGASVVVDPVDSFFIGAKGVPVVGDVGFGLSYNGLIPFEPNATPKDWSGDVFGNVFIKAGLDIGDINPAIPVRIDGDIVIDLDANNDGKNLGGIKSNVSKLVSEGFSAASLGRAAARVFSDIAIAANGQVSVGFDKAGFELSVPVGESSLILSGPRAALFTRGRTAEPFRDTPLSFLKAPLNSTYDIDGYLDLKGKFRLTLSGQTNVFDYRLGGSTLTLDNSGMRLASSIRALGATAALNGNISSNGGFTLTGSANANLANVIKGKASFTLSGGRGGASLRASLSGKVGTNIGSVFVGGSASASLQLSANKNGSLSYAGNARVSLGVGPVAIAPEVSITPNQLGFRVYVLGIVDHWITLNLPR